MSSRFKSNHLFSSVLFDSKIDMMFNFFFKKKKKKIKKIKIHFNFEILFLFKYLQIYYFIYRLLNLLKEVLKKLEIEYLLNYYI